MRHEKSSKSGSVFFTDLLLFILN